MSKKTAFVEKYLSKKKIPTYKEYLKTYAENADEAYRESLAQADTAYARAKASYGTKNASLSARGLSLSGYSDYFDGAAYAARAKSIDAAQKTREESEEKSKASYADYLAGLEKEAEAAYEKNQSSLSSAFSKLLSAEIADTESATQFLLGLGIDEEDARSLAEKNAEILKGTKERRNIVLSYVLSHSLSYEQAYDYAVANGLSEALADEIGRISQLTRNSYYEDKQSY